MLTKIDPHIINKIKSLNTSDSHIECIVYANNYNVTKNYLVKNFASVEIFEYPFILAFGVKVKYSELEEIAKLNEVSYITSNFKVNTLINVSKKILKVNKIDYKNSKNFNHTVAVIDTGVDPILDLTIPRNRIVHFEDLVNQKNTPYDDNGHGTFVTSILCGNGLVSGGKFSGINPNANIVSVKALDENGETGAITILKAMQWIYDNKKRFNIKVVCMSFGSGLTTKKDPLIIGAEVLWNAGIVVVGAGGNSGPEESTIKSPGASSKIITVGALNDQRTENGEFNFKNFTVADFSSRGPILGNYKPDLIAPGVNIVGACSYNLNKVHYKKMSGTSVATPMVAGVASLMISNNFRLTPNDVKRILINNCDSILGDRNSEGFGVLNAEFLTNFYIY